MSFEVWMNKLNNCIRSVAGIDSDDLPDANYMDMYEDGFQPAEAAIAVLENEGF